MKSCVFFGHREKDYTTEITKLKNMIVELIEKEQVTQFYAGARGNFDKLCSQIVFGLKTQYPYIKITKVLSYIPLENEKNTYLHYDDSVYLLERSVPPKYAIIETNKRLIEKADIVFSGVAYDWGGAYKAVQYAKRKNKRIIALYE